MLDFGEGGNAIKKGVIKDSLRFVGTDYYFFFLVEKMRAKWVFFVSNSKEKLSAQLEQSGKVEMFSSPPFLLQKKGGGGGRGESEFNGTLLRPQDERVAAG